MTTVGTDSVTEAIQTHIGGFEPTHAMQVEMFLAGLVETFGELSTALSTVAGRLGEHPIDARVAEHVQQMAGHASTLGDWAEEGRRVFRMVHEHDLERHEAPRPAEHEWDVSTRD